MTGDIADVRFRKVRAEVRRSHGQFPQRPQARPVLTEIVDIAAFPDRPVTVRARVFQQGGKTPLLPIVAAIRRVVRDGVTVEIRRRPFHVADTVTCGKAAGRDAFRRRE